MPHRAVFLSLTALVAVLLSLFSCHSDKIAHLYRAVPSDGWSQGDTLTFPLSEVPQNGHYRLRVGVRVTDTYPYTSLWLVLKSQWQNPMMRRCDTLECRLCDEEGFINGKGLKTHQYLFSLPSVTLTKGQFGTFRVCHIMRKETLQGVSDIGIELSRK